MACAKVSEAVLYYISVLIPRSRCAQKNQDEREKSGSLAVKILLHPLRAAQRKWHEQQPKHVKYPEVVEGDGETRVETEELDIVHQGSEKSAVPGA